MNESDRRIIRQTEEDLKEELNTNKRNSIMRMKISAKLELIQDLRRRFGL